MICKKCNEALVYIGATIGGIQLMGCPKCKLVYYIEKRSRTSNKLHM